MAYLRLTRHRATATREQGLRTLTRGRTPTRPPQTLRGRIRRRALNGSTRHALDRVRPSPDAAAGLSPAPGLAVVYLHGGGFVHGIARQHWDLVGDLADATGAPVYVPHYGRAPRHTVEEVYDLLDTLVEHITLRDGLAVDEEEVDEGDAGQVGEGQRARPPVRIHLAGDSAGGALALLAAQHLRGDDRIVGVSLISPVLDLSQSNPEVPAVEASDPWLSRAGARPLLEAWAGERGLQDPLVSPLFGEFSGLPPIQVFAGTRDICWPDIDLLEQGCRAAGTKITVHAAEGSPHVHVLLPTPEGRRDRAVLLAGVVESLRG